MTLRVGIVGAGAVGSVVGGLLARAGHDVVLLGRAPHVDAVRDHGLVLRSPDGATTVAVAATADPRSLAGRDVLVVLCKAHATRGAIASTAHALVPDGLAVSLQNGLGNDRVLAEAVGIHRAVPGTTTIGAMRAAPGEVTLAPATAAGASTTHVGPPRDRDTIPPLLADWAAAMAAAGMPTVTDPDADRVIWTKLAVAGSMGPLTAVLRRTIADVVATPAAIALWRDLVDEVLAVADAEGVVLDHDAVWAHCVETARGVGAHVTSMAADVTAGRPTEVDAMVTEVVARGRVRGVPTPALATLSRLLRTIDATAAPTPTTA